MKKRLFVDMDGTLAEWRAASSIEECFCKGYFKNLSPQDYVVAGIKDFLTKHPDVDVYILSAVLDTPFAVPEKTAWLKKYIPEIPEDHYIFTTYGEDKFKFIPNGIGRDDYLFDDYTKNLLSWHKAGGTGIKCITYLNHTNKTWKGPYIHADYPPMMLSDLLWNYIY